jgi:hypothetical protein
MKFTHLIEINDPLLPLVEVLTRAQLWRGLVLRAASPKLFVPYLDECIISDRPPNQFARALRYGDVVIRDVVTLAPLEAVTIAVPEQKDIPASSLIMRIEEPQADTLFVRFMYDDGQVVDAGSIDAFYDEYRRSAYQESDIDTIRLVRELAQQGRLDIDGVDLH